MRSNTKRKSKKPLIIAIIIIIILVAAGLCAYHFLSTDGKTTKKVNNEVADNINPLTGLEVKDGELPARPVIVSTGNDNSDARPQAGISEADIVYEIPIEGGGSRYEPIYYSNMPEKCGPTRSARPYVVDIVREYKAVLVHDGWSPQAKEYLETNVIPYYPSALYSDLFYRDTSRNTVDNEYTNLTKVWKKIKEDGNDKSQDLRTFSWLSDSATANGDSVTTVNVNYADRTNNTYKYDSENKLYKRYLNDKKCTDLNNDKQITCSNILIQKVTSVLYENESERLKIDMTEGGDAYLFTQGKMVKGTWTRSDLDSATIFKDKDGKEFKLTPGQTWIELINDSVVFDYK